MKARVGYGMFFSCSSQWLFSASLFAQILTRENSVVACNFGERGGGRKRSVKWEQTVTASLMMSNVRGTRELVWHVQLILPFFLSLSLSFFLSFFFLIDFGLLMFGAPGQRQGRWERRTKGKRGFALWYKSVYTSKLTPQVSWPQKHRSAQNQTKQLLFKVDNCIMRNHTS